MELEPEENERPEPTDGDWCLVDLSDEPVEEATRFAHALGINFEQFMHIALEEKLARLRGDPGSLFLSESSSLTRSVNMGGA